MALTKRELLKSGGIDSQETLVKRLQEQTQVKPVRRDIPSGRHILDQVGQANMSRAVYNWLRGCAYFNEVTISFAGKPDSMQLTKQKVRDLPNTTPGKLPWESHPEGKQFLARQMADVINSQKLVKVQATKEGIFAYVDPTNKFGPRSKATQKDVDEQAKLVEVVKAEMLAANEDPATLEYTPLKVGDDIPNPDWVPFIEFVPQKKRSM